jgi:acetyl esterase/lipase
LAAALAVGLAAIPSYCAGQTSLAPRVSSDKTNSGVRVIRDVSYNDSEKKASNSYKLDLFLPSDKKDFPVVVFVHGGSWMYGDKTFSGWGHGIGRFFAGQGIAAVMPNYRLSPLAQHPEHVQDVAKAFAWTARNIARYGGSPDRLFLCGHSAGGHLVSLLATDEAYLKAEGVKPSAIKGVISVSGVYRLFAVAFRMTVTGKGIAMSFGQLDVGANARTAQHSLKPNKPAKSAALFDLQLDLFSAVFGLNPEVRREASPLSHVKSGLPPFLIVSPAKDVPGFAAMASEFVTALKKAKCDVEELTVQDRNHDSVMFEASRATDPLARAIEKFVLERVKTVVQTAAKN